MLESNMVTQNPSKCFCGSNEPSYYSKLLGGLKLDGTSTSITLNVNEWPFPLDDHFYFLNHEFGLMCDQQYTHYYAPYSANKHVNQNGGKDLYDKECDKINGENG